MQSVMSTEGTMAAPDLLDAYATGAASPGVALAVACHLATLPMGVSGPRERVAATEAVGGALLLADAGEAMEAHALDRTLALLADEAGTGAARHAEPGPFPQVLVDALGVDFDAIPWRFRLPGVSEHVLEGYGEEQVSILRARPGSSVPQHTHEGHEITLVLTGKMEDGGRVLRRGDLTVATESDDHKPRIIGDEICHCLIVMEGGLRFTGRFSRALNYLAE